MLFSDQKPHICFARCLCSCSRDDDCNDARWALPVLFLAALAFTIALLITTGSPSGSFSVMFSLMFFYQSLPIVTQFSSFSIMCTDLLLFISHKHQGQIDAMAGVQIHSSVCVVDHLPVPVGIKRRRIRGLYSAIDDGVATDGLRPASPRSLD